MRKHPGVMQKVPLKPQEILEREKYGEKNLILNLIGIKNFPFMY